MKWKWLGSDKLNGEWEFDQQSFLCGWKHSATIKRRKKRATNQVFWVEWLLRSIPLWTALDSLPQVFPKFCRITPKEANFLWSDKAENFFWSIPQYMSGRRKLGTVLLLINAIPIVDCIHGSLILWWSYSASGRSRERLLKLRRVAGR